MAFLAVAAESSPTLRTIRAAADVTEVDQGGGFSASVYVVPGNVAVARLDRSLRGAAHEGEVLYEAMLATAGMRGPGIHVWYTTTDGTLRSSHLSPDGAPDR